MLSQPDALNVTVIGCGRWGSFIGWYLDRIGHKVTLYGLESAPSFSRLVKERKNEYIELPDSIGLTSEIATVKEADVIVISVNSQNLRSVAGQLRATGAENKTIVLCMKGIEIETGKRLSEIVEESVSSTNRIAVWIGPGHVQSFYRGIPNCMVIDSKDAATKDFVIQRFSGDLIRFYYGNDLIGNEIGAASKNVIGIAAGMLDGFGLTSLKGALMARGTREISRLIKALGGNELSAYGLCHLGDYEATVFSPYSHNRQFGESYVKKEPYTLLAEGYYTAEALMVLADQTGVELPICRAVYEILYHGADPKETMNGLFKRSLKEEF